MIQNVDRNTKQSLNKTNLNNSIGLFFIGLLTAGIPLIMIHNKMQTVKKK
jgi:hypothetical protein